MRKVIISILQKMIQEKTAFWRLREIVRATVEEGENDCLLTKFAVKALKHNTNPWLQWLDLQHPNAMVAPSSNTSFLCKTITTQIPMLQSISFVLTVAPTLTFGWTPGSPPNPLPPPAQTYFCIPPNLWSE